MHGKPCDSIASKQNTTCLQSKILPLPKHYEISNKKIQDTTSCEWYCQTKFIVFVKPIMIAEVNELLFDNQSTQHSLDKRCLMVNCDNNRLIICFIDISECMVASLNLVHQNN